MTDETWRYMVDNIVSSKLEEAFELIDQECYDPDLVRTHLQRIWKLGNDWDYYLRHR